MIIFINTKNFLVSIDLQNESTAKRLHYGNYVRNSSKGDLLQNIIKPLPWSVFLESKKGNAYSLTKEEKVVCFQWIAFNITCFFYQKDLYNESKTYGERVRNRNYVLHNGGGETSRTERRLGPFKVKFYHLLLEFHIIFHRHLNSMMMTTKP